ncbi:hypothetical protein BaRGS_00000324, partial [Batillaria attramentaria]
RQKTENLDLFPRYPKRNTAFPALRHLGDFSRPNLLSLTIPLLRSNAWQPQGASIPVEKSRKRNQPPTGSQAPNVE